MTEKLTYKYTPIRMPIRSKVHPDLKKMQDEVYRWVVEFNLEARDKYENEDLVRFTCHSYPSGSYDRTALIAKFMVHIIALDDAIVVGKEGQFFRSLIFHDNQHEGMACLLDKAENDKEVPVATAWHDIWTQIKSCTNEQWQERFAGGYVWYLRTNEWERKNYRLNRIPPMAEFLAYRHHLVGAYPSLHLIELSRDIFVNDTILADPTVQRATVLAADFTYLINDIYSFEKERVDGHYHNIVSIIKNERNFSYQDAIDETIKIASDTVDCFLATELIFPSFSGEMGYVAHVYMDSLRDWIAGNNEWTMTTGRYKRFLFYGNDL